MPTRKGLYYIAPSSSDFQQELIRLAVKDGFKDDEIRNFFHVLFFPGQLVSLLLIINKILKCLPIVKKLATDKEDQDWELFERICNFIVENIDEIDNAIRNKLDPTIFYFIFDLDVKDKSTHIFKKWGLSRYSLYSTLANDITDTSNDDSYNYFISLFLIAHTRFIKKNITLYDYENYNGTHQAISKDYTNQIYQPSKTLREWSLAEHTSSLITLYNELNFQIKTFSDITILIEKNRLSLLPDSSNYTKIFLKIFNIKKDKSNKNSSSPGGGGGGKIIDGNLRVNATSFLRGIIDDEENIEKLFEFIETLPEEELNEFEIEVSGIPAGEFNQKTLSIYKKKCSKERFCVKKAILAAIGKARAIAKSNQDLSIEYSGQTIAETAKIINYCSTRLRDLSKIWKCDTKLDDNIILESETLLLALSFLSFGSNYKLLARTMCVSKNELTGSELSSVYIYDQNIWRIKAFQLEYQTQLNEDEKTCYRQLTDYLYIPDIIGFCTYIKQFMHARKNNNEYKGSYIFDEILNTRKIENNIKKLFERFIIKKLDIEKRITATSIQHFIFNYLLRHKKWDIADAILLTSQKKEKGTVQIHYTTRKTQTLVTNFAHDMTELIDEINKEFTDNVIETNKIIIPAQTGFVGSRYCPTFEFLQNYIKEFQTRLIDPKLIHDWQAYHNLYTIYVIQLMSYSTLHREVNAPYVKFDDIFNLPIHSHYSANHLKIIIYLRLATISDKDNESKDKTRLAILSDLTYEQLELYKKHLKTIRKKLHGINKKQHAYAQDNEYFLFIDNEMQSLTPTKIKNVIKDFFPVRLNVNRDFIRTSLVEDNFNSTSIDTILGHFTAGKEFFGKFSSISFQKMAINIFEYLSKKQNDIGFKAIASEI